MQNPPDFTRFPAQGYHPLPSLLFLVAKLSPVSAHPEPVPPSGPCHSSPTQTPQTASSLPHLLQVSPTMSPYHSPSLTHNRAPGPAHPILFTLSSSSAVLPIPDTACVYLLKVICSQGEATGSFPISCADFQGSAQFWPHMRAQPTPVGSMTGVEGATLSLGLGFWSGLGS